ncbi:hypothetical protein AGRO_1401 [Agrobacterium sp. ATCC 31749]|nr:hypothetical protein AGRO_1401 [Agrobacterium sp. ATCC 31749]
MEPPRSILEGNHARTTNFSNPLNGYRFFNESSLRARLVTNITNVTRPVIIELLNISSLLHMIGDGRT